jgi:hypothetical protein
MGNCAFRGSSTHLMMGKGEMCMLIALLWLPSVPAYTPGGFVAHHRAKACHKNCQSGEKSLRACRAIMPRAQVCFTTTVHANAEVASNGANLKTEVKPSKSAAGVGVFALQSFDVGDEIIREKPVGAYGYTRLLVSQAATKRNCSALHYLRHFSGRSRLSFPTLDPNIICMRNTAPRSGR